MTRRLLPRGGRALVALAPLLGCVPGTGDPAAAWVELARLHRPEPWSEIAERWSQPGAGVAVREEGDGPVWLTRVVRADAWQVDEGSGCLRTALPFPARGERVRLELDGRELARVPDGRDPASIQPGEFVLAGATILARPPEEESEPELPARAEIGTAMELGREADGLWRVQAAEHSGEGIALYSGHPVSLECPVPPASRLRFLATARRLDEGPDGEPAGPEGSGAVSQVSLQVRLDGALLLEAAIPAFRRAPGSWLEVDLPPGGAAQARLELAIEGPPAKALLLSPVIGPARLGSYAERPWGGRRPTLVLFLADTFRADLMRVYGGNGATPCLDRLAESSLVLRSAYAPSSWTLPSHASMFTGLAPPEHGAIASRTPMEERLVSIAEHLRAHGYRTGAITDSGFLTPELGMDQGFGTFWESLGHDLAATIDEARAFLLADDGRPAFLFVHTYRTHEPYRTGIEEDRSGWQEMQERIRARLEERRVELGLAPWADEGARLAAAAALVREEFAEEQRELYVGAARGLDARFEEFLAMLEEQGVLEGGVLLFTSDHGEAFAEHGDMHHGGELWQEKIRVPLLLHGAGIEARVVDHPASLLDLPATLCALAGIPRHPQFGGDSLLELPAERLIVAHARASASRERLALVLGTRKLMGPFAIEALRSGQLDRAFDLERDPGERANLVREGASWPPELARQLAPRVEAMLEARLEVDPIVLPKDRADNLRALGYVDG